MTLPFTQARHIEAIVHPVDEKDVRPSGPAQQRSRSLRQSGPRMASEVAGTSIGLRLDDARDERRGAGTDLAHEIAPDERARHDEGVALKPRPRQGLRRG